MRTVLTAEIEKQRVAGDPGDGPLGAFRILCPITGRRLLVIASDGRDWADVGLPLPVWEHVSVSSPFGVPLYAEMCWVKDQFWEPTECVVEFHVPAKDHINIHANVLHLWRRVGDVFPMPPKECV